MRFKLRHENPFGPLFSPCCAVFILTFDFVPSLGKTGAQCQFADIPVIVGHLTCTREMHFKSEASDGGLITIQQIINAKIKEPYLFSKLAPLFFSP
jgi:hypothetical protein